VNVVGKLLLSTGLPFEPLGVPLLLVHLATSDPVSGPLDLPDRPQGEEGTIQLRGRRRTDPRRKHVAGSQKYAVGVI